MSDKARRHDADCYVWTLAQVCTCGYFHRTMAEHPYKAPESERERECEHWARLSFLEEHTEPLYVPLSPEEIAKREAMLDEMLRAWPTGGEDARDDR